MIKQKRKVYYIEGVLIEKIKALALKRKVTESFIIRELIEKLK